MPTPTPLSDPTEIREFVIKGDVITQGKGTGLGGVDVSITTKIPTPDGQEEDVKFDTKSSQSGYFTLKFKIQVIPKTRKVLTDWYFDEQKDFIIGNLLVSKENVRPDGDNIKINYSLSYKYKSEIFNVVTDYKTYRNRSAISLGIQESKDEAIAQLYDKIYDFDDGVIETQEEDGYEVNEFPDVKFDFPKYNPKSVTPYRQDKTIKPFLNIVKMETIKKETEKDIAQSGTVDTKTAKRVSEGGTKPLASAQKAIMKAVKNLTDRLIPYIIGILAAFGIAKIAEWLNGQKNFNNTSTTCPSRAKLNAQIRKRNRIVKQLNNLYKTIDVALKTVGIALGLIKIFQVIINVLKYLPLPTSVPPGIGFPVSLINKIRDILGVASGKIKQYAKIAGVVITALILLRGLLAQALSMLKLLDQKMQACAEELGDGDGINEVQIALSAELVELSNQQAEEDNSPVVTNVNGFTMGVEVDPKYKVGTLDRRRAVAKDSKGITILRGEPSFSATDQILIDELAFYITSNNLKA